MSEDIVDKRPLYLRVKLNPLSTYRAFAFVLFAIIGISINKEYPLFFNMAVSSLSSAAIVYILTNISMWTKSEDFLYSLTQILLIMINTVLVLSALLIVFKKG